MPDIENETLDKAKMYETLFITTPELLKLFEMFKKGEIQREKIIKHLKEDSGLFKIK